MAATTKNTGSTENYLGYYKKTLNASNQVLFYFQQQRQGLVTKPHPKILFKLLGFPELCTT